VQQGLQCRARLVSAARFTVNRKAGECRKVYRFEEDWRCAPDFQ
jgi:hypothetical protein